jgi:hypothetical protein
MRRNAILFLTAVVLLLPISYLNAQWINVPPPNAPRTASGEINLKAPAPRRPDGKPDLTGAWSSEDNRYLTNIARDMKAEDFPFQPWSKKLFDERKDGSHSREDPDAHCLPQGVPKIDSVAYPWKVVETPNSIVIIYETFTYWRQIFTDGRQMDPNANPSWMGYSTGKWDGDTFVVDTRGFNGKVWLDQLGRPTTEKLHVTERFRRINYGTLMLDITIDDPGAYTKPFSVTQEIHLRPGWEPLEFICGENNADLPHLPGNASAEAK